MSLNIRLKRTVVSLLVLLFCLGAGASVFRTLGRSWSGWVPVDGFQWEKAYETEMLVNGRRMEMQVFTARYNQPVELQLKQALESVGAEIRTSSSGRAGVATLNGYTVSYMVSAPPSEPVKYIFLSYGDPKSATQRDFPVELYPNGEVLSTVSDVHTRSECATIRTTNSSTEVHEFYRHLLASEGWVLVKPYAVDAGESKGTAVYSKKGQICYIDVVPGKNISSTIVILVEKGD